MATKTVFYEITGTTHPFNLRGMFIRGLNAARKDGKQGPEGDGLGVGEYQADALQRHAHGNAAAGIWGRSFKGEDGSPKTAYEKKDGKAGTTGGTEARPRRIGAEIPPGPLGAPALREQVAEGDGREAGDAGVDAGHGAR